MCNQTLAFKCLFVLSALVVLAKCGYAICMDDLESLTLNSEIRLEGKHFKGCGVGMHRTSLGESYLYIVEFPRISSLIAHRF